MKSEAGTYARWALTCAVLAALTGCGRTATGDADRAAAAAAETAAPASVSIQLPDPCKLHTDEEINAALDKMNNGWKLSQRTFIPFPDIGGGKCDIEARNEQGYTTHFEVSVMPVRTGSVMVGMYKGTRTPIPGVGENAFHVDVTYYAFQKDIIVGIALLGSGRESSIKLLKAAVDRV